MMPQHIALSQTQAMHGTPGPTSYLRMLSTMAGLWAEATACRASQAAKGARSSYLCMPPATSAVPGSVSTCQIASYKRLQEGQ